MEKWVSDPIVYLIGIIIMASIGFFGTVVAIIPY